MKLRTPEGRMRRAEALRKASHVWSGFWGRLILGAKASLVEKGVAL